MGHQNPKSSNGLPKALLSLYIICQKHVYYIGQMGFNHLEFQALSAFGLEIVSFMHMLCFGNSLGDSAERVLRST